jgi:hypothetical protein
MRSADAPLGKRGYEIRILRSEDGVRFSPACSITREAVGIPGFERPALLRDPHTGRYKLYCCTQEDDQWVILKFDDADSPLSFDPTTARTVIAPARPTDPRVSVPIGYKDPVILWAQDKYHCYTIGYIRGNERVFHFTSDDGERWVTGGNPHGLVMDLNGWHDFFVRPASVLPLGAGYLFVYEGSNSGWYDPVYNIATGLAFTWNLHDLIDLTPQTPLLKSSTPSDHYHTWRYSHWLFVDGELWVYAEVARPNGTNEVRLFRLPLQ